MSRQTILIVDDTPDHLDILRRFLQSVGYRVLVATSSADAMDQAQREKPDLILAALSLPGHPGWETAHQLRSLPTLARTPILGTTVYNTLISSSRVRSIGCADYVEKPFNMDDLLHRIGKLISASPWMPAAA
jgi:putative two-component system response regulator